MHLEFISNCTFLQHHHLKLFFIRFAAFSVIFLLFTNRAVFEFQVDRNCDRNKEQKNSRIELTSVPIYDSLSE